MQIGRGKQGIIIGEYEPSTDLNAVIGYIEPACENPQWILWFTNRGDAIFHRQRSYENGSSGAVIDKPIKVNGRSDKPITKHPSKTKSLTRKSP